MPRNSRSFVAALAASLLLGQIGSINARGLKPFGAGEEIDTEHIFGFVEGSDVGKKGQIDGELESSSAIGKRSGRYVASSNEIQLIYSVTDSFRVAPQLDFSYVDISNVPDLSNRRQFEFGGAGFEMRYRLLNWRTAPFGLTLSATPVWGRRDEATGEPIRQFGFEFAVLMDKELVKDRVFAALNFFYQPGWTHIPVEGTSEQEATLGVGAAVSTQIGPGVFVGGELRYFRAYESARLDEFAGQALYLGPTALITLSSRAHLAFAWNVQVAGKAVGEPGPLDLTNFERHQVRVRLGVSF